jgi:anti-sigma factor RsiW
MKCSKAHKLISPYIDGELMERDVKPLEEHIKGCHKCRAEFEESNELHNLFANADKFKAPYGFHARVMASVSTSKTGRLFWVSIPRRLAEAVMVLVLIAAGIVSGTFLVRGLLRVQTRDAVASLHLDVFESAPPDTLGGAYLAMTEVRNEK